MFATWGYAVKLNKPDTERQVLHIFIKYRKNLLSMGESNREGDLEKVREGKDKRQ